MNKKLLYIGLAAIGAASLAALWIVHSTAPKWNPPLTEKDFTAAQAKLGRETVQFVIHPMPQRAGQTVRVAIGRLDEPAQHGDEIADLTLAGLGSCPGVQPVERRALNAVMSEAGLGAAGIVRAKDAVRAGHLAKADWFLLGTGIQLGTNHSIVARMVDAQTGALIDANVVDTGQGQEAAAGQLVSFVAKVRTNSVDGKAQDFLAAGSFGNWSINDRLMDFPSQLRGYLTAAYRAGHITFLEREYISVLLDETMMDLAGLTDSTGTNHGAMQSAFWLAEGTFQSYEVNGQGVELDLNVNRTFGKTAEFNIRAAPGEPAYKKVKEAIDNAMRADSSTPIWSRTTEIRYQLRAGGTLLSANNGWDLNGMSDPAAIEKARRNEEEAVRAFETAVALDPTNRSARLSLASCFCNALIGRAEKARDIYRQIIEDPMKDQWTQFAKTSLDNSWMYPGPDEVSRWYAHAAATATDPDARQFYLGHAELGLDDKGRLFKQIAIQAKNEIGARSEDFFMSSFVGSGEGNPTNKAKQLCDWLPELQAKYPAFAPHLLASVLSAQVESNNPAVEEFRQSLSGNMSNVARIADSLGYLENVRKAAVWAAHYSHPDLAAAAWKSIIQNGRAFRNERFDTDTISLGLAYELAGDWKSALKTFKGFSKRPIHDNVATLFGTPCEIVHPTTQIALCEQKLGLPVERDSRQFEMENGQWLKAAFAFAVDEAGVWLAVNGQLISMDFNMHTNFSVWMPNSPLAGWPTCVQVAPEKIWVGTSSGGIVEFDRASKQCRRITEKDGLSMNQVCSLCEAGDTMWIGYLHGLGCMNLATGEAKFFTPTLKDRSGREENPDAPTADQVSAIAVLDGAIWFVPHGLPMRVYHPQEGSWSSHPETGDSQQFIIDSAGRLVIAESRDDATNNLLGVTVLSPAGGKVERVLAPDCLPSRRVMAIAAPIGDEVWIGGFGYIARVSLKTLAVERYAYTQSDEVESIQTGGGCIWTRMGGVFTRTPMPAD